MATLEGTNISTAVKKTDDFTFSEWKGQFVYENILDQGVSSVQVTANNTGRYMTASISHTNNNINFSGEYDADLVSAVVAECAKLLVTAEQEQPEP